MSGVLSMLDFAGYVALLLWGVHMVQTGVQRAFGSALNAFLGRTLGTRARAFMAGLGITAALQSSTATGLMITGFAAAGAVALVPALAAMLGANVGTTLIVQLLSFDLTSLAPILILAGVWMFRRYPPGRARDLGRVFIGLGLLLLSLHSLVALFEPIEQDPLLSTILQSLSSQPVLAVLISAAITWAAHSSVAVVVLVMSLVSHGVVDMELAFALVLGANLGTAVNPMLEGVSGDDPASRRLPMGNLLTRVAGVLAGLVLLPWVTPFLSGMASDPGHAVANFHTIFNIAVAAVFLPLLTPYGALLTRWLPKRVDPNDPARPQYLDESAHDVPAVALGNARREALRMTDMLQTLLLYSRAGFKRDNRHRLIQARQLDQAIDKLETAITTYVATLDQENMTQADRQQLDAVLAYVSNIGHAADVAYHGLLGHVARLRKLSLQLAPEQRTHVDETLGELIANQRQAAALFVNDDLRQARALAGEKTRFRMLESEAAESHLQKIKSGEVDAAEAGALYLDILRDMKGINTYLVEASAYPLLARHGELLPSRLRDATSV
ncbi:Na/Pi cotransporter [Bordetella trematum]|uniref:Na+/Pi-cotransporter n=1 Tax=Bordetella trematum TaxID=123899 RepID=A0A157LJC6_9BORD|nr:Na/Pi cotransporter family protein [Bordetella trematum]AUL47837.1 Na/Pi cotransporter [Bordetella trematum]AZR94759.1 Na/Pi cotransporter [Bordetella trematum]NNH19523.1 Na/Pi cotransporter family protein [Bordetella trematum]SAH96710.1 Na+/Pi-cotransporter [Bordetella trematum]SAI41854.1 Na+/Pi-cotransporter [Bordetella trematum]